MLGRRQFDVFPKPACGGVYPRVVFFALAPPFPHQEAGNRNRSVALVLEVGHAVERGFERIAFVPILVGHPDPSAVVPALPSETSGEEIVITPVAAVFGGLPLGQAGVGEAVLHGIE